MIKKVIGRISMLVVIIGLSSFSLMAQQLDYYPQKKADVSDDNYKYGITILKETYAKVKKDNNVFNYADYWNLAVAFSAMKSDIGLAKEYLYKSRELNPVHFAKIFIDIGGSEERWHDVLTKEEYIALRSESEKLNKTSTTASAEASKRTFAQASPPNMDITALMAKVAADDQKYRSGGVSDPAKQLPLDKANLIIIDSVYQIYRTYLGKKIVGSQYSSVMWLVIQHSDIQTMERYLPVINEAVYQSDLNEESLKLLLDRISAIKNHYQYFGSQKGIAMATDAQIAAISQKYAIGKRASGSTAFPKLMKTNGQL